MIRLRTRCTYTSFSVRARINIVCGLRISKLPPIPPAFNSVEFALADTTWYKFNLPSTLSFPSPLAAIIETLNCTQFQTVNRERWRAPRNQEIRSYKQLTKKRRLSLTRVSRCIGYAVVGDTGIADVGDVREASQRYI